MPARKRSASNPKPSDLTPPILRDRAAVIRHHYEFGKALLVRDERREPTDPVDCSTSPSNVSSAAAAYKPKQFARMVQEADVARFEGLARQGLLSWTHLLHLLPLPRQSWDPWIEIVVTTRLSASQLEKRLAQEVKHGLRTASPGRKLGRPFTPTKSRADVVTTLISLCDGPIRFLRSVVTDSGRHRLAPQQREEFAATLGQLESHLVGLQRLG